MPDGSLRGKSSGWCDPKRLRHYRHEFGSILRLHHPNKFNTTGIEWPADPNAKELALHLIATHHGGCRPHFRTALYDGFADEERDALHTESIRRFARLQRTYGWWKLAWLENLLRCADALASASPDAEDDDAEEIDTEGGDQ
jgi:CRISPR-associated endonuclease/helicase Cas3